MKTAIKIQPPSLKTTQKIARKLLFDLKQLPKDANGNLSLPSLTEMAERFHVSRMDIHEALQILRHCGYDYLLQSMDVPILVWLLTPQ